jgi:hypothetical protein
VKAKEIALEKLWNLLIALIIGEIATAFHYGMKAKVWLVAGFIAFILLFSGIIWLSKMIEGGE